MVRPDGIPEELDALIARVEAATGLDQELDAALYRALGGEVPTEFMGTGLKLSWDASGKAWCYLPGGMRVSFTPPALTISIDAAVALMESALPGYRWGVSATGVRTGERTEEGWSRYADGFRAHVTEHSALRPMPTTADALTAPLAIILATLRAIRKGAQ
jgi:hypothetical protein